MTDSPVRHIPSVSLPPLLHTRREMSQPEPPTTARLEPALIVIAAGVCAALHIGKLPPAITTLGEALGLTLVQAGFLLSLVQAAGMTLGLAFGAVADGLGLRRSMIARPVRAGGGQRAGRRRDGCAGADGAARRGRLRLPARGAAGARAGAAAGGAAAREPDARPVGRLHAVRHRAGAADRAAVDRRRWAGAAGGGGWAALSLAMALVLARAVPAHAGPVGSVCARPRLPPCGTGWAARLRQTLAAPGPWLVAVTFALYSGQWLAVIGFLPAIYTQAGVSGAATARAHGAGGGGQHGRQHRLGPAAAARRAGAAAAGRGFHDHGRWRPWPPSPAARRPACRAGCATRRCWRFRASAG